MSTNNPENSLEDLNKKIERETAAMELEIETEYEKIFQEFVKIAPKHEIEDLELLR